MMPDILENPTVRFGGLLGLVMILEAGALLGLHVKLEPIELERHETIRIALVHPKPAAPKPVQAKPHKVVRKALKPAPKPIVLPKATATSTNLLAAAVGNRVSLGWGSTTTDKGTPSDYTPPNLLTKVDTDALYTAKMKDSDEEGDVVIELWLDKKGHIKRHKLVIPSVYDDLNNAALGVLKRLRFDPAAYKGSAVEGKFQLNFRFRIRNS